MDIDDRNFVVKRLAASGIATHTDEIPYEDPTRHRHRVFVMGAGIFPARAILGFDH